MEAQVTDGVAIAADAGARVGGSLDLLQPPPAGIGPPFAALVAALVANLAPLRVADRQSSDPKRLQRDPVAAALVVVGESIRARAHLEAAPMDLHPHQSRQR